MQHATPETQLRIGLLCFLPDAGHVMPLLRIGRVLADAGHEVTGFFPEESRGAAEQCGCTFVSLGRFASPLLARAQASFRYSFFGNRIDARRVHEYWAELEHRTSLCIEGLTARLARRPLDVLVTDDHVFRDVYTRLARTLDVPLLLHHAEGTLRRWQLTRRRAYFYFNGFRPGGITVRRYGVGMSQLLQHKLFSRWRSRSAARSRRVARLRRDARRRLAAVLGPAAAGRGRLVSTGTGALEVERCPGLMVPRDVTLLGPVVTEDARRLPPTLRAWLDASRGPLVYVSFGTMVQVTSRQAHMVLGALRRAGVRAVWAVPAAARGALDRVRLPRSVYVGGNLPQAALLARPELALCISHGGAGTVQEALAHGKPMLCIPALWDQFYNATLVESLGAGLQLRWRTLTARGLSAAVSRLLHEPAFREVAGRIMLEIRSLAGAERIRALVEETAAAHRPARTVAHA